MLILVRHGESESNAAGVLVGRSDPPLTPLGLRQAEVTARFIAGALSGRTGGSGAAARRPPVIVSSPLGRALVTARAIASALGSAVEIELDERLVELDYGDLDGRRMADLDRSTVDSWRHDPSWRPPRGETLRELGARVVAFCEDVAERASAGNVVAVSHVSPIKAAAGWAIGAGPELAWRTTLAISSVTRIETVPRSLHSFGETGHLAALS